MLGTEALMERIDGSRFTRRQAGLFAIIAVCLLVALSALVGGSNDSGLKRAASTGTEESLIAPGFAGEIRDGGDNAGAVPAAPPMPQVQGSTSIATGGGSGGATSGSKDLASGSATSSDAFSAPGDVSAAGTAGAVSADPTRIVQTGDVSLEVAKGGVSPTVDKLSTIATSLRGRVSSTKTSSATDNPFASITMRIPVAKYGQAVAQITKLGTVLQSNSSGEDVTAQYTDQTARLHALEASRNTYLTLLAKANNIGEVLSVQQRIDGVQQQIESLQGQIKVLADRSDYSTITVNVSEKGAKAFVVPTERSGINKAFHDGIHNFNSGVERIVAGAGTVLLLLVCLAVIVVAVRIARRFVRRPASEPAAAESA